MLLHFRTALAAEIKVHNLRNGNYIGVTQELKIIPLVYDTTDEEFYIATDLDFDTPVDMTGIEVAYMDNQDAIYQQAEVEELLATPAEDPEEEDEPETQDDSAMPTPKPVADYDDDNSAINTQL